MNIEADTEMDRDSGKGREERFLVFQLLVMIMKLIVHLIFCSRRVSSSMPFSFQSHLLMSSTISYACDSRPRIMIH